MEIAVSDKGWTCHDLALKWILHFDVSTRETVGKHRLLILDGHLSHATLDFVRYCEDHLIIPLCLPPHATHILQPLDVAFFGPLAHVYKLLVRENALFGAVRVSNEQFLEWFQVARLWVTKNIPSAWRKAGLIPFNAAVVLDTIRPRTPPKASFTDENGVTIDTTFPGESLAKQINDLVAQVSNLCHTPCSSRPCLN